MRRLLATLSFALLLTACASAGANQQPTHSRQVAPVAPSPDLGHALAAAAYIDAAQVHAYLDAQHALVLAYLEANAPPPPAPAPANNGAHSDAWWHGVAVCEQGGRNDPFFGYFSIMDGSAGGLDWSTQVAMANAIIARSGDGAWAQSCQDAGYAASRAG